MDYDLTIIPDEITVTGMVVGIGLGTSFPAIRAGPVDARRRRGGLLGGDDRAAGRGGLLTQLVRLAGSLASGARRWVSAT